MLLQEDAGDTGVLLDRLQVSRDDDCQVRRGWVQGGLGPELLLVSIGTYTLLSRDVKFM